MPRTLVTGATGFIGSAIMGELLAARHEVRAHIRQLGYEVDGEKEARVLVFHIEGTDYTD